MSSTSSSSSSFPSPFLIRSAIAITLGAAAAAYLYTRHSRTKRTPTIHVSDDEALYVGVDGGGTSTSVVILNSSSTLLAQSSAPSTNHNSLGSDQCEFHLRQGLISALHIIFPNDNDTELITRLDNVRSICCAMSGCNRPADAALIRTWIQHIFPHPPQHIHVYNDSVGALASGTMGVLHGIVLISGTGMIAYGRRDGPHSCEHVAAGNGALIDAGSGYAIGMDVLRACFSAHDGMGPSTKLLPTTLSHLKLQSAPDLLGWLYPDLSWARPASLAPLAFKLAAGSSTERDPVAYEILTRNADFLIRAVKTVAEKLQFGKEEVTVVLNGGILQDPTMYSLVSSGIRSFLPYANLTYPRVDPAHGAALLAKNLSLQIATFANA